MAEQFDVEREHTTTGGRYFVRLDDSSEAELTYRQLDPRTIIAKHTGVPPQHRNRGIALQLVEAAIADARGPFGRNVFSCAVGPEPPGINTHCPPGIDATQPI